LVVETAVEADVESVDTPVDSDDTWLLVVERPVEADVDREET
jgi:hypothetical protein